MKRTQYFKWGLTAFLTVCAVLVFYDTFYQAGTLQQFVSKLASILACPGWNEPLRRCGKSSSKKS